MKLLKLRPKERETLSVVPVARYRDPRYPSFEDPDPTNVPERVPFPFRSEVSIALATAAIGCLDQASAIPIPAQRKLPEESAKPVVVETPKENPFLLSRSGLPHRTSPFGTGAPSHIADDIARRVIEKVFKENGIDLDSGSYEEHGLAFDVDGYDPKTKLGFVFVSYKTLDEDAIVDWRKANELRDPEDSRQPPAGEPVEVTLKKRWKRMIDGVKLLSSDDRRALEKEYLEGPLGPESESWKRQSALSQDLYVRARRGVAVSPEKLAYWEAQKLEQLSATKQAFIAVISTFDERFLYGGEYSAQTRARFEEIAKITDEKERRAAVEKVQEDAAKETIMRLEDEVRRYIAWARSQGL